MSESAKYREIIDRLVADCSFERVRAQVAAGRWSGSEREEAEALIAGLSASQREVLAEMLTKAKVGAVHDFLAMLDWMQVEPFVSQAVEGDAHHDFVGRLDGWEWPN